MGHWHAPIYAASLAELGIDLVGASDPDGAAGAASAVRLGLAFDADAGAMLDRLRPDVAFVLPRHDRAMATVAPVLARRLPFLIEKPMGLNGAEAQAVADAARGGFAAAALSNRSLAIWRRVAALRQAGSLGRVMHAHFRVVNGPPGRYRDWGVGWMLEPALSGGGALRNLGFHAADAALNVAAGQKLEVCGAAIGHAAYALPVEEFATALLAVPGGPAITIEAGYSYAAAGGDMEWRIASTGAYLRETRGRLEVRLADGTLEANDVPPPGYTAFIAEMLACLRDGRPSPASLDDCAAAARLIDQIYTLSHTRSTQ